jgi:carboxypeptidase Q
MRYRAATACILLIAAGVASAQDDVDRLVAAMLGDTPIVADLQSLTDEVGGRVTGSPSNEQAVDWALARFRQAEVPASRESFEMPFQWQERGVSASISGDFNFSPDVVAKPFSAAADSLAGPLVDGGMGAADDFGRLGDAAEGAWILVETPVLDDVVGLAGLFGEYSAAAATEAMAADAGARGIVFMSSRTNNLLYRLPMLSGVDRLPLLLMEREEAQRAQRLLQNGHELALTATIDVDSGYAYQSANVIAEIRGSERPDEIVLMGAHLDSHDLGTGALDNGSNVTMMIDIARQITRLGLEPERTIRFALWNGEEQGLVGSWRYTQQHRNELDDHIMAASFDIGTGRILGFFTGGMEGLVPMVDEYLQPVAGLGPFTQVNVPLVGTDNFDFMMEGVPNLIAAQADANYASNYHAASDTFDKVDVQQLKLNSAIAAALVWGFANDDARLPRWSREQVESLVESTDLEQQMRNFGVWEDWASGKRGRQP